MIVRCRATRTRRTLIALILPAIFLALFLPLCASAQESGGTIVGVVTDPQGGVVAGSNVIIKNTATGAERVAPPNAQGVYTAPNLIPGNYEISCTASGFAPTIIKDVVVAVGDQREIDIHLTVGQVAETVTVNSGSASDVQLATSAVGNVVDSHTVVELPLNGRDWTSLTLLEPGVAQIRTQKALGINNDRPNRGLGVALTIGGNRPQQNNYRLDGVSINDYASGAPGSITGSVLGVDAVQEFSVVTSNAPADYGKTSGGVINAATRSGSNSFHGTAYEFARNAALDARNFFDPKGAPPFSRNQFGGSAGGRILRDRTFFFADYEGLRQNQGNTTVDDVPSQAARNGTLCSIPQPNCVTTQLPAGANTDANGVNLLVKPYLALYPLPNGALSPNGDTGKFSFVSQQVTREDFLTTRIDHKISGSDDIHGTYLYDRGNTAAPDIFNFKQNGDISRRHTLAIEETHIFTPSLLNTFRLGYNRTVSIAPTTLNAINPAATDANLGFDPGLPVGLINIPGITAFQGGIGALGEYDFHYNSYQLNQDLYYTRGKHSFKFGFAGEMIRSNQLTHGVSPNGQYIFGALQSFLQNQPTSFNTFLGSAITPRDLRESIFAGYMQDDYKFRPNLTVNLGLRYEMATVPTETRNQLATLATPTDAAPKLGSPYFQNPTRRNFEPRIGFAWDPFSDGKTSIRAAYGIYDVLPLPYQFELLTLLAGPFAKAGNIAYPNAAAAQDQFPKKSFTQLNPTRLRFAYVDQNPHRNYVQQWSMDFERQIVPSLTLTLGYIGSHGVHQPYHPDDINSVQPTVQPDGTLAWPANRQGTRLNPNVGQIAAIIWGVSSTYEGLDVKVIKRMSHGFQIQGSYTFSKALDTGSSSIAGDTFGNSVSSLPLNPKARRGPSDFDVRQIAAINTIWMVPGSHSDNNFLRWTSNGWQVGGIFSATGGLPLTPIIAGDPLGLLSADTYAFPNRVPNCNPVDSSFKSHALHYLSTSCFTFPASNLPANTTVPRLLGNSGRNTVSGPGLTDLDLAFFKNNPIHRISETSNLQFRWEIFNVANHANFNVPTPSNRQVFTAAGATNGNFGLLNSTSTPSRQMQLAVKYIW